jgi:hypothetical protein
MTKTKHTKRITRMSSSPIMPFEQVALDATTRMRRCRGGKEECKGNGRSSFHSVLDLRNDPSRHLLDASVDRLVISHAQLRTASLFACLRELRLTRLQTPQRMRPHSAATRFYLGAPTPVRRCESGGPREPPD